MGCRPVSDSIRYPCLAFVWLHPGSRTRSLGTLDKTSPRIPERIVFTAILDNLPGHELVARVTFAEEGGKTRLTVRQTTPSGEAGRGQNQGWSETLERLADLLAEEIRHGRSK